MDGVAAGRAAYAIGQSAPGGTRQAIEDSGLVQHIEAAMRADLDGYARNRQAQEEYCAALERLNAQPPAEPPRLFTARDARRVAEIERAMRTDGGRAYWNSPAMQREYSEILERQVALPAMRAPEPAADDIKPVDDSAWTI